MRVIVRISGLKRTFDRGKKRERRAAPPENVGQALVNPAPIKGRVDRRRLSHISPQKKAAGAEPAAKARGAIQLR
jgi:hypothetical protein